MDRFIVYNFSGDVDEISHLFPSERFARIAAVISGAGRHVEIMDRANFADLIDLGADFMEDLSRLSFHDTSPLYERTLAREADAVLDRRPDCLFMNLWHGTGFKFSMDLLTLLKRRAPALHIYGIGQKVDEFKEHIFEFAGGHLDGLVAGLGYDAVTRMVSGAAGEEVPNLILDSGGKEGLAPRQAIDVDDYPEPLYDGEVYGGIGEKVPIYSISLSNQACPNQCAFCIRPEVYGRTVRKRKIANVLREIGDLHVGRGATHFRIEDSTPPRQSLTALAKAIVESDLQGTIRLSAFSRVDINRAEDFPLLKKAGILSLFFGIESLDEGTLKLLAKRTTYPVIADTVRRAHDAGILTVGSFIFPTPGATPEAMETTLGRIAELKPWLDSVLVLPAGVQPQTDWARHPGKYGIELGENYLRDGVIYPIKYLVPMRHWKPFPFSYRLMGREARDVPFEQIVKNQSMFVDRVRNRIGIPGIPDYYYLMADLLNRTPVDVAGQIVGAMMERNYVGMRAIFR